MKLFKKAAALFFCLTLALSVMAVSASAADVTYTIALEPTTTRNIIDGDSSPDYNIGETVTYNIKLTASANAIVDAVQFTLAKPTGAAFAITAQDNGSVAFNDLTNATDGLVQYEAANSSKAPWSLTKDEPKTIGTITFTTPSVMAATEYTFSIESATLQDQVAGQEPQNVGFIANSSTVNATATIEVHPQYTVTLMTYKANADGTIKATAEAASPATVTYNIWGTGTIAAQTLANYTFKGWKVSNNTGNWTDISTNSDYTTFNDKYGNVTLTADFEETKYEVTYNLDGGTITNRTLTPKSDDTTGNVYNYTVETAQADFGTASKTGYTFKGWKVETAVGNWQAQTYGTADAYSNMYGNVTLKADFEAITYHATFEAGDSAYYGSASGVSSTAVDYTVESVANLTALSDPTLTGYTFAGWTTTGWGNDGTTYGATSPLTVFSPGATHIENVTFTATWTAIDYTITYTNGVDETTASAPSGVPSTASSFTIAKETAEAFVTPTRNGYRFDGWKVTSESVGSWTKDDVYVSGIPDTSKNEKNFEAHVYGNVTLEAQWTLKKYTVTYDGGSVTYPTDSQASEVPAQNTDANIETALAPASPTRPGYTFMGWKATVEQGKEGNWTNGTVYGIGDNPFAAGKFGDVTFTAQWEAAIYVMTFKPGATDAVIEGKDAGVDTTANYSPTSIGDINAVSVSRTGYTFTGWKVTSETTDDDSWTKGNTIGNATTQGQFAEGNYGTVEVTATWEITGQFKTLAYKYAYNKTGDTDSAVLILFGVNDAPGSGGYTYNEQTMWTTTLYNSLFDGSNLTVYATVAKEVTEEDGKDLVAYSASASNSPVSYNGEINATSGVDVGDYGTTGSIFGNPELFKDDVGAEARVKMNMTGEKTGEYYGNINDIKQIMNLAAGLNADGTAKDSGNGG